MDQYYLRVDFGDPEISSEASLIFRQYGEKVPLGEFRRRMTRRFQANPCRIVGQESLDRPEPLTPDAPEEGNVQEGRVRYYMIQNGVVLRDGFYTRIS